MGGKTVSKKTKSIPNYLRPTCASLAKRVSNGDQFSDEQSMTPFRSYSRFSSSTFSSNIDLDQRRRRGSSVQPSYMKGTSKSLLMLSRLSDVETKSSRAMQKNAPAKEEEKKATKLRGGLKGRALSIKECSMTEKKPRIKRPQSEARSTADSAISVSMAKRTKAKKSEKRIHRLDPCPSMDLRDNVESTLPKIQTKNEKKTAQKGGKIPKSTLVNVIGRLEKQTRAVADLYDLAILINRKNEITKSQEDVKPNEKKKKKKKPPPSETTITKLKALVDYSKNLGTWAWSEVSNSRSFRAVVAWAVLNLAIYFPSWLKPILSCSGDIGYGLTADNGLYSIIKSLGLGCAASVPSDLLRSLLAVLTVI